MQIIVLIYSLVLIKITSSQILSNGLRNFANMPNSINLAKSFADNRPPLSRNFGNNLHMNRPDYMESEALSGFPGQGWNPERIGANLANAEYANIANANLAYPNGLSANFANNRFPGIGAPASGPGGNGLGLKIIADALEIGGNIAVSGKMPIYGSVALNGNVPSDGTAAVQYNCGAHKLIDS